MVTIPTGGLAAPQIGAAPTPQPRMGPAGPSGLSELGAVLGEVADRIRRQQDATNLATLENEAIDRLDALQGEVLQDPDYATAVERYKAGSDKLLGEIGAKARSRAVGEAFRQSMGRRAVVSGTTVRGESLKRSRDALVSVTAETLDGHSQRFARASTDTERLDTMIGARKVFDNAVQAGAYDSLEEADAAWKTFEVSTERARVLALVQDQQWVGAAEVIKTSRLLDDKEKLTLEKTRAAAQEGSHRDLLEANERSVTDLAIRVSRGEATQTEIDAMRDVMTESRYEGLTEELDRNLEVGREARALDEMVGRAINGEGPPLDPSDKDHRDAVSRRWTRNAAALAASNATPLEILDHGRELVSRTGVVPESLRLNLIGWLRGEDPEQAVPAGNFVADIIERNPRVSDAFDAREREFAVMLSQLTTGGMDARLAMQTATDAVYKVDNVTRETRRRQWKEGDYEEKLPGQFARRLKDLFPGAGRGFPLFGSRAQHAEAATQYATFTRAHFEATGDIDAARALADQDMKRRWGMTSIGGKRRIAPVPPELAYGTGRRDAEWMGEQMVEDIATVLAQGAIIEEEVNLPAEGKGRQRFLTENVQLDVTPDTIRSDRPQYGVSVRDKDGNLWPVLDAEGQQLRWQPDFRSSPAATRADAEIKAQREAAMAEARSAQAAIDTGGRIAARAEIPSISTARKGPRGIRNNNPGNIRRTGEAWLGMTADQTDSDFIVFETPAAGLRSLARVLSNYQTIHGLTTVEQIVDRWAPQNENNTTAYSADVARRMGVAAGQQIDLSDIGTLRSLMKAVIQHENGQQPYTDAQIDEGIRLRSASRL